MKAIIALLVVFVVTGYIHCRTSSFWLQGFNIQVFGVTKLENKEVFETLIDITKRVDFIVIQEVRDKSGAALPEFVDRLNRRRTYKYNYIVSERLGRTSSKEQYAFVYKEDSFTVLKSYQYEDSNDYFERPPFGLIVQRGHLQFFVMVCHVSPRSADAEIGHLRTVYDDLVNDTRISAEHRAIIKDRTVIVGDFNADCGYLSKKRLKNNPLYKDPRFNWILEGDTTVAKSYCNYDRFVVTNGMLPLISDSHVFKFDDYYNIPYEQAIKISDHYPIEMRIKYTYDDDDEGKPLALN